MTPTIPSRLGRRATRGEKKPSAIAVRVGRQIKAARTRRGWTQSELAARVGSGRSYIARLEAGEYEASLSFLVKLAKALRLTVADLVR